MLAITVDNSFLFAVSPESRSCPCFFSGVVSLVSVRKVLAEHPIQPIIQLSIGKTKSRYIDIKNRRELCFRFKMMKLCIGFEIQSVASAV